MPVALFMFRYANLSKYLSGQMILIRNGTRPAVAWAGFFGIMLQRRAAAGITLAASTGAGASERTA
jgi:hypothetical protein